MYFESAEVSKDIFMTVRHRLAEMTLGSALQKILTKKF